MCFTVQNVKGDFEIFVWCVYIDFWLGCRVLSVQLVNCFQV